MDVVLVEPGAMDTPLLHAIEGVDTADRDWARLSPAHQRLYGLPYLRKLNAAVQFLLRIMVSNPQLVVDTLDDIITARFPRARYLRSQNELSPSFPAATR